jgi:hypothetical protein
MKPVRYRLPDSVETVRAFCLWEETGDKTLLFVPPVEKIRGATLVIAERPNGDEVFEDSPANTFPIEDWSAAMISVFLMLIVKDDSINQPTKFE